MPSKYPLYAVEALRAHRAGARARELGTRVQELALSERAARDVFAELSRERERERALANAANERLEAGLERALDLSRAFDAARASRLRQEELVESEQRANARVREASRSRDEALRALHHAEAELAAVERHHERFLARRDERREKAEEETALERWNAGRFASFRR